MNNLQDLYNKHYEERFKFILDRLIQWIIENDIPSYNYDEFISRLMRFEFIDYLPIENMNDVTQIINRIVANNQFSRSL